MEARDGDVAPYSTIGPQKGGKWCPPDSTGLGDARLNDQIAPRKLKLRRICKVAPRKSMNRDQVL